jgi:hypothetical protein
VPDFFGNFKPPPNGIFTPPLTAEGYLPQKDAKGRKKKEGKWSVINDQ